MKRFLFAITLMTATLGISAQGNQCPGCAIDPACDNPAANFPALCPAVLTSGTQGQTYAQDITFFMPYIIDAEGFTGLHLEEVTIVGISGVPAGLSWTTSHYPTNFYDVSTDPNTQRGCAQICGTPLLSGAYTPTVNVIVKVCNIPIVGCTTLAQTFVLPLQIDAVPGGNPYFSFSPQTGCGSLTVDYDALLNLGTPQVTEYAWDFDNGNTSSLQNPPDETYSTPGEYHPTLVTNVYNYAFNAMSANVTGGWWCGDIEELNCSSGNADIKFTLTHGSATYNGAEVGNTINPSWSNLGVVLSSLTIALQFTEVDNVSASDNGGSYAFVVPGEGTYNFSTTAITSGGGGINGNFTIIKQLFNAYTVTDTVVVKALPPITDVVSSSNSFSMCANSPITLSVYGGGYSYEWYMNDTVAIPGATDSSYTIPDPGSYPFINNYRVKITDPVTGCATITPNVTVTVNESFPPQFGTMGATYFSGILSTNYAAASYQWLLNGTALVPSGQVQSYTPTVNGNYSVVATNAAGCSDTSNVIAIFNMGIENAASLEPFISVYPNPSNGEFTVNMDVIESSKLQIALYDVSGKAVHTEDFGGFSGKWNKTFNLTHLSAGVYTLNVVMDQGTVRYKLIIR